jgi:hypothetical protein
LQRGEELKAFADIESVIVLTVNHQRRRFEFVREQMRRKFPIQLALFPRAQMAVMAGQASCLTLMLCIKPPSDAKRVAVRRDEDGDD